MATASAITPLIKTGDDLSRLFRDHYRRVLRGAYRITGNMADAEDVAQAVFLRVSGGEGLPVDNAASYLYRSGINGALDLLRRRKTWTTESLEGAAQMAYTGMGGMPEAEFGSRQLGDRLRLAISELSPRAAEIFVLRYIEDFGNREIAAILGTSQAVIAVTIYQTRLKLRKRLREMEREKR